MEKFYAHVFVEMARALGVVSAAVLAAPNVKPGQTDIEALTAIQDSCLEMGLRLSAMCASRVLSDVTKGSMQGQAYSNQLGELHRRISDEMSLALFFHVPREKADYYEQEAPFGEKVKQAFPSAIIDIEEAAKCYALGRNTACVFHLMRVLEIGLRELGKSLNDPRIDPTTNPTWERVLKRCDEELAKPIAQRTAEWRKDDTFFSEAAANLRAVKNAWRNPSIHVGQVYDEERAQDIFSAVRGFMHHLATKIGE